MAKGNPNPRTDHLEPTKWKPGKSGNPGGFTAAMKALQAENAMLATENRNRLLRIWANKTDAELAEALDANMVATVKQADDRHNGTPQAKVEHSGFVAMLPEDVAET